MVFLNACLESGYQNARMPSPPELTSIKNADVGKSTESLEQLFCETGRFSISSSPFPKITALYVQETME